MMDISQLSDAELLSRVAAGDAAAEEALAERYSRLVRICARPLFLAGGDSEDLIQEGMLGLLSAIRQYDRRPTSVQSICGGLYQQPHLQCHQVRFKAEAFSAQQRHFPRQHPLRRITDPGVHLSGSKLSCY